jgi:D-alanine-D-alanine ligase and related ATP-grasp enzymes
MELVVPEINRILGDELFIKPISGGSSIGAKYAGSREVLEKYLLELLQVYHELMVEEFVRGKEATVGVLERFRNEQFYALPVVEIIPPAEDPIFSYENKYNGKTNEICPARFSYQEKSALESIAKQIHSTLRCNHYSRSDFIIAAGEVYFLEINTLPGLTNESLYPKSAEAVGLKFNDLINHIISISMPNKHLDL